MCSKERNTLSKHQYENEHTIEVETLACSNKAVQAKISIMVTGENNNPLSLCK
jgi:hypothetical protein